MVKSKTPFMVLRYHVWHFRITVPEDLRLHFGKREITQALGKDRKVSQDRAHQLAAHWRSEFRAVRKKLEESHSFDAPSLVPEEDLVQLAHRFMEDEYEAAFQWLRDDPDRDFEEADWTIDTALSSYREFIKHGDVSGELDSTTVRLIAQQNLPVPEGSSDFRQLRRKVARAKVQAWVVALGKRFPERPESKHDFWDDLTDGLPMTGGTQRPFKGRARSLRGGKSSRSFMEVYKAWVSEKGAKWSSTTEANYATGADLFVKVCGDLPVTEIEKRHVRKVRDIADNLPKPWRTDEAMKQRKPEDLAADETITGPRISEETVNRYLNVVRGALKFAVEEEEIEANPAEGVRSQQETTDERSREPWSVEQLNALFKAEEFQKPKKDWTHKQWLPLVALFSGARQSELVKLRTEDIREIGGVLCIDIVDRGGRERLKNKASARPVPVHSQLVKLGFKKYVERVKERGEERLWPEYSVPAKGAYGKVYSQEFARMRQRCGVDGVDFHGIRHTVRDALREAGVPVDRAEALGGWSASAGTSSIYGRGFTTKALQKEIAKVRYQGLGLSHLQDQKASQR